MVLKDIDILHYDKVEARDAFMYEELRYDDKNRTLHIVVHSNSDYLKASTDNKDVFKDISLEFTFYRVLFFRLNLTEMKGLYSGEEIDMYLDSEDMVGSNFREIINSKIVEQNKSVSHKELYHYILDTYDNSIECVCEGFDIVEGIKEMSYMS